MSPPGPIAAEPDLRFVAESVPVQSGRPAGFRLVIGLLLVGSLATTILFWMLGAWPVAGFMGVEVVGVVTLLLAHRRWSGRARERITLRADALRVEREDGRGRRMAASLDAYWARVSLNPRPGRISELRVVSRGRSVEVGYFLVEAEKQRLAEALTAALSELRTPVFDNPQLRAPVA